MTDLRQHAESIADQFSEHLDVSTDEVEARLETLVSEYKIPAEEARRSVTNHYLDEAELDRDVLGGGSNSEVQLGEIDAAEQGSTSRSRSSTSGSPEATRSRRWDYWAIHRAP